MSFTERYKKLNTAQRQAVDTIDGPVMVIAGPGTGKTELLSVRIANILQKTDTLPENILCLTFTESGQTAMRERLVGIIGQDAYKVAIHTFHSFGSEIISHYREYFYHNALFQPADDLKQYEILRSIFDGLAFSNPLSSMMNDEYTYLSDTKKAISELKRSSALTSDELLAIIQQSETSLDKIEKLLVPILEERVNKSTAQKLYAALEEIREYSSTVEPLYEVPPLARVVTQSLTTMLEEVETIHPTKPISAWKAQWLKRDERKQLVFKNREKLVKLKALSFVYYDYLNEMEKQGLYDYDDMIMQTIHAIEVYDDLRFNLQEKYLYLMVDEFQDTNVAQMRLLHNLTNNPVNDDKPNILVVGDDDQAIFGFQGADSSNILNFIDEYPHYQRIVLTDNYRSGPEILTASRTVITQGTDRLETKFPDLSKALVAKEVSRSSVEIWHTTNIDSERYEIARHIKEALDNGTDASSIAVLARKHSDIQSLLPFFRHHHIPIRYERQESVLDSPPIHSLELVARVVIALAEGNHDQAQAALPEVLAHPAWHLTPEALWRLSLDAYHTKKNWMECMATMPDFVPAYQWLIARAREASGQNLEPMIDALMGQPTTDDSSPSPYFSYYFSLEALKENPSVYIDYLESLRVIRAQLRDYLPGVSLTLKHLVEFIDLHRRLGVSIISNRSVASNDGPAVQLLTAHKSKGLEFDTVYLFNAVDSIWGQTARTQSRAISYPENLPLSPAGNTVDERLRLFYVAMTRAKHNLIISYSDANDSDKPQMCADFLLPVDAPTLNKNHSSNIEEHETAVLSWYEPLITPTTSLKTVLKPQLEQFKLSATSLNNFLAVTKGGPRYFLLNNLLHFPSSKPAPAAYGTAVHRTMQQLHAHMIATKQRKPLEDSLRDFEVALSRERLTPADFQYYFQQGSEHIPLFLQSNAVPLSPLQKTEYNVAHQDIRVGDSRLTGSIDVINIDTADKTLVITDYKTGQPRQAWDKGTDYAKTSLHAYRQQLLFYKLLAEGSAEFGGYTVTTGQLAFIQPTKTGETVVLSLDLTHEDMERFRQLIEAVWHHIITLNLPDISRYSEDLKGILAFEQDLIDGVI